MDWVLSAIAGFGFVAATFSIAYVFAPKGWRTAVFNAVTGAGTVAVPVTDHLAKVPWATIVDEKTAFFVVQGCLVANVIWRAKTNSPMGKKINSPMGEKTRPTAETSGDVSGKA